MSNKKVLLDANILIRALDEKKEPEASSLKDLMSGKHVTVFTTSLIRYEVLRGWKGENNASLDDAKEVLIQFVHVDITIEVSDLAADLFKASYKKNEGSNGYNPDKRRFDIFHFATTKIHGLELITEDEDFKALEGLYKGL